LCIRNGNENYTNNNLNFYKKNIYNLDLFAKYIYNDLPPIYVINLKDSRGISRRESLKNNVIKHRVNVIITSAVDMKTTPNKQNDNKAINAHGRKLKLGEIALVRSHSNLYIMLLESNLPYLLIAEDDICVSDSFNNKLRNILSNLPKDFEVIKLEYGDFDKNKVVEKPNKITYKNGNEFWVNGSGLYIISREAAKKILHCNDPYRPWCASDGSFDRCLSKEKVYTTLPPLGWQSNEPQLKLGGWRNKNENFNQI
jgi:GR25 family glycosyltransferase involved in LPS biosynthesis